MFRTLVLAIAVAALAGCAQRGHVPPEKINTHAAVCSEGATSYATIAKCRNDKDYQLYSQAGHAYLDLLNLLHSYRYAMAVKADAGEVTEADMNLKIAEMAARVNSEVQHRNALNAQARSQRTAAIGSLLSGLGQWQSSLQQPTRGIVTCSRTATGVICY